MPVLRIAPVRPGSRAIVVGNGPSARSIPWPRVRQWIAETRGSWADCFLMNRVALGPTRGRFSVAVGPEVLRMFHEERLYERSRVLTNCPWKVTAPEDFAATFGGILSDPGSIFATEEWPPHASGPLAVWAAAALGYEEILLWGLDGTAGPPQDAPDWMHRALTWEWAIREWRAARAYEPTGQRLVRLWPAGGGVPFEEDPLRPALSESVVVPIQLRFNVNP